MDSSQSHWENVYRTRLPGQVSWFRPHLETSLSFIQRAAAHSAPVIDVGGGESTLVDDLLAQGYEDITVLDISATAIDVTRARLGCVADRVKWLVADITAADLPLSAFSVWHDRAVFHFLTDPFKQAAYVEKVRATVSSGGYVIIGTFGPEGPVKCSGLDVQRYDAESLHRQFARGFRLIDEVTEMHQTPFGTTQQFLYCFFEVE